VLVLPAKASDAVGSLALRHGHLYGLATDFSVRSLALLPADLQKGLIGDRFHVAIA
jgi:hypothetical protein